MILGDKLDVSECVPINLGGQHAATFVDDDNKLVALCICDNHFVVYSGAALSMIPVDVANEVIAGGALTEVMVANFYEVMNICSKLLMSDSSAHLRLDKALRPDEASESICSLEASAQIAGFGVDIPRYGKGALTFVVI